MLGIMICFSLALNILEFWAIIWIAVHEVLGGLQCS